MNSNYSKQNSVIHQIKISFLGGLLTGIIIGGSLAIYNTWFLNYYIQKGLTHFVIEIFSEYIIQATLAATLIFLFLLPFVAFFSQTISEIRAIRLARFTLMLVGIIWVIGGYQINKSIWFPPIASAKGILGNMFYSFICLGLAFLLYKIMMAFRLKLPLPFAGLLHKLYNGKLLSAIASIFIVANGCTIYHLANHKPNSPNVVILSIDTLRADHLGCYGYERNTSPTIDKLASEGVQFSNCYAQRGLTWPSLTSIMTAMYPKTHGVRRNQVPLDGKNITIAEILKNEGYKTGAFLANYYFSPNRGFDTKMGGEIGDLDYAITGQALGWLNGINPQEDNFFLWIHYKNPHLPYEPPEPFTNMFDSTYTGQYDGSRKSVNSIYVNKTELEERDLDHIVALYDAEIRSTDSYIELILQKLKAMNVYDNTIIVFISDHGEELYERNYYFDHACSIYDGVLRIPLVIKYSDVIPAGKIMENQIESIDITPTILNILKVPLRDEFEGRSIFGMILDDSSDVWFPSFADRSIVINSIRTPQWKYIYNPEDYHAVCVTGAVEDDGEGYDVEIEELYNIQTDPSEQVNLAEQFPNIAKELRAEIINWLNTNKKVHKEYTLSKEAEKRLRALGYVK